MLRFLRTGLLLNQKTSFRPKSSKVGHCLKQDLEDKQFNGKLLTKTVVGVVEGKRFFFGCLKGLP